MARNQKTIYLDEASIDLVNDICENSGKTFSQTVNEIIQKQNHLISEINDLENEKVILKDELYEYRKFQESAKIVMKVLNK